MNLGILFVATFVFAFIFLAVRTVWRHGKKPSPAPPTAPDRKETVQEIAPASSLKHVRLPRRYSKPEAEDMLSLVENPHVRLRVLQVPDALYDSSETPSQTWFCSLRQHYLAGYGGGAGATVMCLKESDGMGGWRNECPACDEHKRLWTWYGQLEQAGNFSKAEEVRQMAIRCKPMPRYYYNVLVNGSNKVQILSANRSIHEQIQSIHEERKAELMEPFYNLETGYDFIIDRQTHHAHGWPTFRVMACKPSPVYLSMKEVENLRPWSFGSLKAHWVKSREEIRSLLSEYALV